MSEVDGYIPWNPRRLCDTCGDWYRLSELSRHPGNVWVCNDKCAKERTATELSIANARQKPFLYRPVKNAKPEDPFNPDTFEADDAPILDFIARMVTATARFESVTSGTPTPKTTSASVIPGLAWAGRYLYQLIQQTESSKIETRATSMLTSIATYLLTRQYGSLTGPVQSSSSAYEGAFETSGATTLITVDMAAAGLALLYAYRVTGTQSYLTGARATASYLRAVQAIGSSGDHYTSSDAPGTVRLYTGSLCSEVLGPGIDDAFYSNHVFYPSALLALEFWNELMTTDGDQTIGYGDPPGFIDNMNQLLSESIADLRACWTNGITDATSTLVNGLSSTTPREFFNSYPAIKPHFADGTGMWEFYDGAFNTGTQITSMNFSLALGAIYAYEGATTQVTTIDTWLRSFTSNPDYETADGAAASTVARANTGDYDATACFSTVLLVRDADDSYASITLNGSSVYDWGSFGVLSPLWSSIHQGTFADARRSACGINFRYADGLRSDGDYKDRISLRGTSGLTYQTATATSDGMVNDLVRASMFGISLRQLPKSTTPPPS